MNWKKQFVEELIWVFVILLASVLAMGQMTGFKNLLNTGIEFQIQNTYVVLTNFYFLYPVFPCLLFAVYFIKVITLNFGNIVANVILILSGVVVIVFTSGAIDLIDQLTSGWFILPSTESLPLERIIPESHLLRARTLLQVLRIIEFSVLLIAIVLTYTSLRRNRFPN